MLREKDCRRTRCIDVEGSSRSGEYAESGGAAGGGGGDVKEEEEEP